MWLSFQLVLRKSWKKTSSSRTEEYTKRQGKQERLIRTNDRQKSNIISKDSIKRTGIKHTWVGKSTSVSRVYYLATRIRKRKYGTYQSTQEVGIQLQLYENPVDAGSHWITPITSANLVLIEAVLLSQSEYVSTYGTETGWLSSVFL